MENYFNYFTEIEEHFQRRRGGILLLSTLDWALIETWKDAGIPLEAALRGIDAAFDRYDQRPSKSKKVNSLAYCAQQVLSAAEDMKEAAVGAAQEEDASPAVATRGFDPSEIAAFLRKNAERLEQAKLPSRGSISPQTLAREAAATLRDLGEEVSAQKKVRLEDIERRLTVLEEKLLAALIAATADDDLVGVRAQADRELAPYRSKMPGPQIEQLLKQYVHKRLLEKYGLPRLSLFYM
ncbi:MAG: hypothetical protein DMG81_02095 [Acidobacteria bacterium]|nr:MAG: hypothetical protein DMG81_02095 [Acidobacteriota bacterium]